MTALQRFIAASGMTNLADGIAVVAWGWIASLLTRDALLPVALRLPWFLLALPAGLVTDRVDRRRLILAMDAVRGLAFAATAYGLMLAGGAVGGIVGSLLGERIAAALGPVRTMQVMLAASGPCFAVIAVAPGPVTVALSFAAMEFTGLVWNVVSVSTRQRMIPDAIMGR